MFYIELKIKINKNVNKILVKNLNQLKQVLVKNLITNLPPLPNAASTVKLEEQANDNKSLNKLIITSNDLMKVNQSQLFCIALKILT